jgi:phospholipid/cholesterol/gamma-HCH transport system permease protein
LGIDPIHYFVVPRVLGMAVGLFALTIYMMLGTLVSGYLWAFIQDVPLTPADYFRQLADSLRWIDFVIIALKALMFGAAIAIVTCYQGLAQPLRLEEVPRATVRAVAHAVVAIALTDAFFIIIYLVG